MHRPRFVHGVLLRLLILLCAGMTAAAGDRVRVAAYNLQNYTLTNRVVEGVYRVDYPKPESEKAALRRIIAEIRPDVLAVQEIGPMPFVLELQRDLHREGVEYPHIALLEEADPTRKIAVLSRLPFRSVTRHTDISFPYYEERRTMRRGLLEVRFESAGVEWALFTLHLKSKWTERADDPQAVSLRVAEALGARDRIRAAFPEGEGHLFLVAGDFNDSVATATLRRFLHVGGRAITEIVPAADSRGETWTHFWDRHEVYSRIDFLLASPAMLGYLATGAGHVVDHPEWREASDHRMVYVDLDFDRVESGEAAYRSSTGSSSGSEVCSGRSLP